MGRTTSARLAEALSLPTFILKDEALCAQTDPELFFPEEKDYSKISYYTDVKAAKEICSNCPLVIDCLEYSLVNHPLQGIWGGLTEPERSKLIKRSRVHWKVTTVLK